MLYPVQRPTEIDTKDCLVPSVSRVFMHLLYLRIGLPVLWVTSAALAFLAYYEVFQVWWSGLAGLLYLPALACFAACINKQSVRRLAVSFQTMYLALNAVVMTAALVAAVRQSPQQVIAFSSFFPFFVISGFMDGFPESGRLWTSRVFFIFNILALISLVGSIGMRWIQITDFEITITAGWAMKISNLFLGCAGNLIAFGCKNLFFSFYLRGSLVVDKSELVVCKIAKFEAHLLRVSHCLFAKEALSKASVRRMASRDPALRRVMAGDWTEMLGHLKDLEPIGARTGDMALAGNLRRYEQPIGVGPIETPLPLPSINGDIVDMVSIAPGVGLTEIAIPDE